MPFEHTDIYVRKDELKPSQAFVVENRATMPPESCRDAITLV